MQLQQKRLDILRRITILLCLEKKMKKKDFDCIHQRLTKQKREIEAQIKKNH